MVGSGAASGAAGPVAGEVVCCPRFDPRPWRDRTVRWAQRPFVRARVRCLWHVPLGFGAVMARTQAQLDRAGVRDPTGLTLCDASSPWHTELYVAVTRPLDGLDNVPISGTFVTDVSEGPYRHVGQRVRDLEARLRARGQPPLRILVWYTTCPKCAQRFGKNYMVLFAEVGDADGGAAVSAA
jgi:hypothetical protein